MLMPELPLLAELLRCGHNYCKFGRVPLIFMAGRG
jgi:hypothetical protein